MNVIIDLFTNPMIMIPVASWFTAQIIKIIINAVLLHEFKLERLFGDGGMPSGHSATVTALACICGWCFGFGSVYFAFAGILAIIVMNDAAGVRQETGKQAVQIKRLADIVNGMFQGEDKQVRTENLKEFVGHTPIQVVFGAILGLCISILYLVIAGVEYESFNLILATLY